MAENTKKTNEKMMCEEHNVETYEACAECGKPICIMCKTFQYEEVFPKKEEKVCSECYKKRVKGKTRELIVYGVLGVVLAIVLASLAGPGLIPFGLLAPYTARGFHPKFNHDKTVLQFFYIFTVFVCAATAVLPLFYLVMEIKLLMAQKKEVEELEKEV